MGTYNIIVKCHENDVTGLTSSLESVEKSCAALDSSRATFTNGLVLGVIVEAVRTNRRNDEELSTNDHPH